VTLVALVVAVLEVVEAEAGRLTLSLLTLLTQFFITKNTKTPKSVTYITLNNIFLLNFYIFIAKTLFLCHYRVYN